jgi:hypothetical protein
MGRRVMLNREKQDTTHKSERKTGCILLIKITLLAEAAGAGFNARVENKQVTDF